MEFELRQINDTPKPPTCHREIDAYERENFQRISFLPTLRARLRDHGQEPVPLHGL
jgi:hypothetical protein